MGALGKKERPSAKKAAACAATARAIGRPKYDEETREMVNNARIRGARALPVVVDDIVLVATTGYTRYVNKDGRESFERVEPDTKLHAARFLGDRCGLPVRNETEVSTDADFGPVVMRFFGPE
jgi:hypothetical protein